jgi:hypothetical protein
MSFEGFLVAQLSIKTVVLSVGIANVVVAVEFIPNRNNNNSRKTKTNEKNDSSISMMEPW